MQKLFPTKKIESFVMTKRQFLFLFLYVLPLTLVICSPKDLIEVSERCESIIMKYRIGEVSKIIINYMYIILQPNRKLIKY